MSTNSFRSTVLAHTYRVSAHFDDQLWTCQKRRTPPLGGISFISLPKFRSRTLKYLTEGRPKWTMAKWLVIRSSLHTTYNWTKPNPHCHLTNLGSNVNLKMCHMVRKYELMTKDDLPLRPSGCQKLISGSFKIRQAWLIYMSHSVGHFCPEWNYGSIPPDNYSQMIRNPINTLSTAFVTTKMKPR